MSGGVDPEKEIIQAMAQATGRPAISTASSLMAALAALNANRIVFVSESPADHHASKESYLRQAGLDIAASKGMALPGTDTYCITPPEYWLDCVSEMRDDSVDAYFVSCANIHATYIIEQLEEGLDRPVLSSNQVALWCALRTVGIDDDLPELGRLFKHGLVVPSAASAAE
jgi:maleate isomerase